MKRYLLIISFIMCLSVKIKAQNAEVNFLNKIVQIEQQKSVDASKLRGAAFAKFIEERQKELGGFGSFQQNALQILENFVQYESLTAFYALNEISNKDQSQWLLQNLPMNSKVIIEKARSSYSATNESFKSILPPQGRGLSGEWKILYAQLEQLQKSYQAYYSDPNNLKYNEALQLYQQGKYAEALVILRGLEKAEFPLGMNLLAEMYYNGKGVNEDLKQAFKLYKQAADANLPSAMNMVSICYAFGIGTDPSPESSVTYYKKALMANDPSAKQIEELKEYGKKNGTSIYLKAIQTADNQQRISLLEQAALMYHTESINALIKMEATELELIEVLFWSVLGTSLRDYYSLRNYEYYTSNDMSILIGLSGVLLDTKNIKLDQLAYRVGYQLSYYKDKQDKTVKWYQIAEYFGNKDCFYELGKIYSTEGQYYDLNKAKAYYQKSLESGHPLAEIALQLLNNKK